MRNAGYVVFGACPVSATGIDSLVLECTLADGSMSELPISPSQVISFPSHRAGGKIGPIFRQSNTLLKRGFSLLRSGHFTLLFEKVGRYLDGRPTGTLKTPSDLVTLLEPREREHVCLILDRDLGGGANRYRNRLVDSLIGEGRSVIILTYHVTAFTFMLIVKNSRIHVRYAIPNLPFLVEAVKPLSVGEIVYNTAVSFIRPDEIPPLLIRLKAVTSARLKVLLHDFYLVCPSHFLLNDEGNYCNIPEVGICEKCLPKNGQGFATLFVERDIRKWRAIWGTLLASADEIVAFSNNTAQLLMKAYPQLDASRIAIVPHQVEPCIGPLPQIENADRLCIGVVGQIGTHKGAAFVRGLAQEIRHRALDVKIVVIGKIEATCEASVVRQTGPYQHKELPRLIETSGVNVILFPSICPETFSYVVHEMIALGLPVASFNLGAPAERLSSYSRGRVLASMDPADVLDELIAFHKKIYLAP